MADINDAIVLSQQSIQMINDIKAKQDFNFRMWSDDDLLSVRKEIRTYYRKVQKGKCAYCRQPISRSPNGCHVEHIVAKSIREDFMFTPNNLCVICPDCNEIKREKEIIHTVESALNKNDTRLYPRSSGAFIIYHPHFDFYNQHIAEIDGYYFDRTDKGAQTIRICVLNRKLRDFGYDDSAIAIPGHLDLMMKIFYSGKLDKIKKILEDDDVADV